MITATIMTKNTIEEPTDVFVLLKIKDQAAPPALAGEDVAQVYQPAGDEELEDDHNTELDLNLLEVTLDRHFGMSLSDVTFGSQEGRHRSSLAYIVHNCSTFSALVGFKSSIFIFLYY